MSRIPTDTSSIFCRECEGGGILDIDCNASPEEICKRPIENVYWPEGEAPDGVCRYSAVLFNSSEAPKSVEFRLQALVGKTVVHEESGRLTPNGRESETFEYFAHKEPRR